MKKIKQTNRRVANIHTAEFTPIETDGTPMARCCS